MITPEEIGEIAVFSSLGPAEREQLSRAAADLSLVPSFVTADWRGGDAPGSR